MFFHISCQIYPTLSFLEQSFSNLKAPLSTTAFSSPLPTTWVYIRHLWALTSIKPMRFSFLPLNASASVPLSHIQWFLLMLPRQQHLFPWATFVMAWLPRFHKVSPASPLLIPPSEKVSFPGSLPSLPFSNVNNPFTQAL